METLILCRECQSRSSGELKMTLFHLRKCVSPSYDLYASISRKSNYHSIPVWTYISYSTSNSHLQIKTRHFVYLYAYTISHVLYINQLTAFDVYTRQCNILFRCSWRVYSSLFDFTCTPRKVFLKPNSAINKLIDTMLRCCDKMLEY